MKRFISCTAGVAILVGSTVATLWAIGGLWSPTALVVVAICLGLIIGAPAVGWAWGERRYALCVVLFTALLAGEAASLIATGERIVSARDAQRAPSDVHQSRTADALKRVEVAEARLDASAKPPSNPSKCDDDCRRVRRDDRGAAEREVATARTQLESVRSAAVGGGSLAARLGLSETTFDLIAAILGSVALNGTGACLIAYGAHGKRPPAQPRASHGAAMAGSDVADHVETFTRERLQIDPTGHVTVKDIAAAYREHCHVNGLRPHCDIAIALRDQFMALGLSSAGTGDGLAVGGVRILGPTRSRSKSRTWWQ